jgi:hypothetical protein
MPLHTLARSMGRCVNLIREHEAGYRPMRVDDLFRAARALRVRPSELIYIKEPPTDERAATDQN